MPPAHRSSWLATAGVVAWASVAARDVAEAQTRRAVLVGVSRYPEQDGWPALPGAAADVDLMRATLLAHGGFEAQNVVVLRDEEAKRLAIQGELEKLAAKSKPGDLALFYFAGHGSRLPDQEQDPDELDDLDETIVPFDAGKANDIRDDWIGDWITRANQRTDQVVLLFDCCSSGTNTRGGAGTVRYLDARARGFDVARPSPVGVEVPETRSQGYAPAGGRYVVLTACRATEKAYEVRIPAVEGRPEKVHGAFTWELVQGIEALRGQGTWADLSAHVGARLLGQPERQTPTIEGRLAGYRLFSSEAAPNARRFGLARNAGGTWLLEGGTLHALAAGAMLSVGPGAARRDELAARTGRIRIVRAGREKSEVAWEEGAAPEPVDGVTPACSAFLLEHGTDAVRLPLAIAGDDVPATELARKLESSNLFVRTDVADCELSIVRETGPTRERWVVQSRRGRALPLSAGLGANEEIDRLCDNLARLAHARRARTLLVNDAANTIALDISLRTIPHEDEPPAELPRDAAGAMLVPSGTALRLVLANASALPVHAAVLWIAPDGEISLLAGTAEEEVIPPGESATYDIVPELPPGRDAFFAESPLALVCVASVAWHDFAPLFQDPVTQAATRGGRGSGPQSDPLECDGWSTRVLELVLAQSAR